MAYHSKNTLYRDKREGMVAGVCSGLSDYFRVDVTLIRIVAAALILAWGSGLLAYILLWIFVPEKPEFDQ